MRKKKDNTGIYGRIDNIAKYADISIGNDDENIIGEEEVAKVKGQKAKENGLDFYDYDGDDIDYDDIEEEEMEEEDAVEEDSEEEKREKEERREEKKKAQQRLREREETKRESMMSAAYWFNEMHKEGAKGITSDEKRYLELIIIELSEFYFPNLDVLPPDKDKEAVEKIKKSIEKFDADAAR